MRAHAERSRTTLKGSGWLGGHGGAQRLEPTMEPGLGGPDGDAEDLGRLGQGQVEVEVQHHHRALVDREPAELAARSGPVPRR